MQRKTSSILICLIALAVSSGFAVAVCPPADLTGDCIVDFSDFAVMAVYWPLTDFNDVTEVTAQWLAEGVPNDPCNLVWVYIDDPGVPGHESFTGYMSKYETTNAQYCEYLNAAFASGDIYITGGTVYGSNGSNSGADYANFAYFDTSSGSSYSQIIYHDYKFSVRSRDGYSMVDHPVVQISWFGATAFCNYYGYRLPTQWEWQAVADYDGSCSYGCGTSIDQGKANYDDANPLNLSDYPYTNPVDYYCSYGYGLTDMAGNVSEWTSSCCDPDCIYSLRAIRGGCWHYHGYACTVCCQESDYRDHKHSSIGFRACR
ncbi:MAG: formylglycine-generating enzyme family protein [Sedimentisphaerales bacterium]|nr:formylglycine-generating enzyme family protein [Sedimentisphaerales bacterium]